MSQDVYCVARTDDQAQEIIEKIQKMGIGPDSFKVVAKPEEVDRTAYRASEEARNAANGAVGGTIIGLLFGGAVLSTMGFAGIPGLFEAILLLACAALGGGGDQSRRSIALHPGPQRCRARSLDRDHECIGRSRRSLCR